MSIKARSIVEDWTVGGPTLKLVLTLMADYASDTGENIFPSIESIARRSELHPRSVQRAIKDLVDRGFLTIVEIRPGQTTKYSIPLTLCRGDIVTPRHSDTPTHSHPTPDTPSPNPSLNRQEEKKKEAHEEPAPRIKTPEGSLPMLNVVDNPSFAVLTILEEVPACYRNPKQQDRDREQRAKWIQEFIDSKPEVKDAQWLEIARFTRDDKLTRPSMKENSTFEASPTSILRETFAKAWASIQANDGIKPKVKVELSPECLDVRNALPDLWNAIETMIRRWNAAGMGKAFPSPEKFAEYTKTLSRCGISAGHVAHNEELLTRDFKWAPTAWDFAQMVLAKVNERKQVIMIDESADEDRRESNITIFGKAEPTMKELRDHYREKLGVHEEAVS